VFLKQGQCELRFQEVLGPDFGWPIPLLGTGADVAFASGAPMSVYGDPLPGYQMHLGLSLLRQGALSCSDTLRWVKLGRPASCWTVDGACQLASLLGCCTPMHHTTQACCRPVAFWQGQLTCCCPHQLASPVLSP